MLADIHISAFNACDIPYLVLVDHVFADIQTFSFINLDMIFVLVALKALSGNFLCV